MIKKILFVGDSSLLSRNEVNYDNIYTTLLKEKLDKKYILETSGKAGNTSREIYRNLDLFMLYGYNPDMAILNYGMVDTFPRPYPYMLHGILRCMGILPYIDKMLKKMTLYYRVGELFNFKIVSVKKFQFYSESIVKTLLDKGVHKIIIIGIIRPYKVLLQSKSIDREIKLYNQVYQKLALEYEEVKYIDIYNDSSEAYTIWDGYHYSDIASKYLAKEIERLIIDD